MSDFDMLNQKAAAQKAVRRRDALRRTAYLLGFVLAVMLVLAGLAYIHFISKLFMAILMGGTALVAAFNAGRIWNSFMR